MTLVAVDPGEVDALSRGESGGRATAPGWPHTDTAAGLGFARSGGWQFLILDDEDRIAGECGTKAPPSADGAVEIGYGLAAPSRGRGLGTTAVSELVDWLGDRPEVRVIEAEVHLMNTASQRVLERLGFTVADPPDEGFLRFRRTVKGGTR